MVFVLLRAGVVAIACILIKLALSIVIMPLIGGKLDPVNWFLFVISPALVAMPAATYIFWKDFRLKRALLALKSAHRDLDQAHRRLGEQARRDTMTGLLNRGSFFAAMEELRSECAHGTLLIIDADNFKTVNDTFGHMAGDTALVEIAAALREAIRGGDIVGRIGGEEFAIFLPGAIGPEATVVAERIRSAVDDVEFLPVPERRLRLTVSIGGVSAGPVLTTSELMRLADRRLYQAKRAGRNTTVLGEGGRSTLAA